MKYHIITFGCQMNHSDSERMAGVFEKLGMHITHDKHDTDVVVINACSVRQKAIDRIWGQLKEFDMIRKKRTDRPLYTVLTGCVLPADRPAFAEKFDLYFPMKDLPNLPAMIQRALMDTNAGHVKPKITQIKKAKLPTVNELITDKQINYHKNTENNKTQKTIKHSEIINHKSTVPLSPISQTPAAQEHYLQSKPKYANTFSAFVPIMTGCNAFCTYCAVPFTRGREVSRKPQEIINEVEQLVADGYKEITLLGQIINKYMVPADETFIKFLDWTLSKHGSSIERVPELNDEDLRTHKLFKFHHLLAVINEFNGGFWLRFTSSHPKWFSDTLIKTIARCSKIPPHIHLPVQAGSDTVLKRMLRPYTIEEYKPIINNLRSSIPGVAITTDVIVGFSEETDQEFQETKDLFSWAKFDMAYISQYSTRPGTRAEQQLKDDVPQEIKKQRETDLNDVLKSFALEHNQKLIGQTLSVLVDKCEPIKNEEKFTCSGKTGTFKTVRFSSDQDLTGTFANIEITDATAWNLKGILK